MKEITSAEFETEVLAGGKVVLDFYSTECPPCEAVAPKFEGLAKLYGNDIKFLKIFRQQNRELATTLGVKSSTTLLFFDGGVQSPVTLSGGIKRSDIIRQLDTMLPGGQVSTTHEVSNYPGFIEPQPGYMLSHNMSEQPKLCGTVYKVAVDVSMIDLVKKEVVVIGSGNSAVEEADFISRFASKITMVHQFDALTANKQAKEKLFANPKIDVLFSHEPRSFVRDGNMMITEVEDLKTKTRTRLSGDGTIAAIAIAKELN